MELFKKLVLVATLAVVAGNASAMQPEYTVGPKGGIKHLGKYVNPNNQAAMAAFNAWQNAQHQPQPSKKCGASLKTKLVAAKNFVAGRAVATAVAAKDLVVRKAVAAKNAVGNMLPSKQAVKNFFTSPRMIKAYKLAGLTVAEIASLAAFFDGITSDIDGAALTEVLGGIAGTAASTYGIYQTVTH